MRRVDDGAVYKVCRSSRILAQLTRFVTPRGSWGYRGHTQMGGAALIIGQVDRRSDIAITFSEFRVNILIFHS